MSTTTNNDNSQTYRFESSTTTYDNEEIFRDELFIRVAAAMVQKWPTREQTDFDKIAAVSVQLTKALTSQYKRAFLEEER